MNPQKLVLSVSILTLGFTCFVLGLVALIIPHWGTYWNRVRGERGHFGPWLVCKDIGYGRTICGDYISSFKPDFAVFSAGICAAVGMAALGLYLLSNVLQMTMECKRSRIFVNYFTVICTKLILSVTAALLAIVAVSLFSTQGHDFEKGYVIETSISFYMEIILVIFAFILMLLTLLEFLIARRLPSDPFQNERTQEANGRRRWLLPKMGFGTTNTPGTRTTTIGNPGFRDENGRLHTNGISMTDSSVRFVSSPAAAQGPPSLSRLALARQISSAKQNSHSSRGSKPKRGRGKTPPVVSPNKSNNSHDPWNGSVTSLSPGSNGSSLSSVSTVSTLASTVITNPRGLPLRSSLKKSKPATPSSEDGFGIQNPGFAGTSPTLSRTGSLKKVRIQTQSTDV